MFVGAWSPSEWSLEGYLFQNGEGEMQTFPRASNKIFSQRGPNVSGRLGAGLVSSKGPGLPHRGSALGCGKAAVV